MTEFAAFLGKAEHDFLGALAGVKPDPPPRRDGRCRVCRGERKGPSKRAQKRYVDIGHYELDPFCSTGCCREWHGCVPPKPVVGALGYEPPVKMRRHGTETMYEQEKCRCDQCRAAAANGRKKRRQKKAAAAADKVAAS